MNGFDDILKNKLENYREMPSQDVFLKIRSQYPKPGFKDILGRYKYYFIAAVATVAVISGIIVFNSGSKKLPALNDNVENNQVVVNDKYQEIVKDKIIVKDDLNIPVIKPIVASDNNPPIEEKLINENLAKEIVYQNVFGFGDTAICGFQFETEFNANYNSIVLPNNVKALYINNNLRLLANKQGSYTVYYSEVKGNVVVRDSVIITFNKTKTPDVSLSDEILCPGEELLINVRNTQSEPVWNPNLKVN
jgi:hypothetical protein